MSFSLDLAFLHHDPHEFTLVGMMFSGTLREFWIPMAERLNLDMLRDLASLHITDADGATQLAQELTRLELALQSGAHLLDLPEDIQKHFLKRIELLMPYVQNAADHWDEMIAISATKTPV